MDKTRGRSGGLLARFAEFYEEVAHVRHAIREGRLAQHLALSREGGLQPSEDLAASVSQRLKTRMLDQRKQVASSATQAEIDTHHTAQYAMAALADELLILGTDWAGQDAWQHYLLERGLFGTSCAGTRFYQHLERLLSSRLVGPLEEDLAAVYLISLRLGFKGEHRGSRGAPRLKHYNQRLLRFVGAADSGHQVSFQQAYQHRITGTSDERLAPLARWYRLGLMGLALYLLLSTLAWLLLTGRLASVFSVS